MKDKSFLFVIFIICSLWLTGCRTKQIQTERKEEVVSDHRQTKKDSIFKQEKQGKSTVFQVDNSQSFEMELESDTLKGKSLIFERIRSPAGEKIIVQGGKVRLKVGSTNKQFQSQTGMTLKKKGITRTNIQENKTTENKYFTKQKEVKTSPFRWLWLMMFVAGIVILVMVFLQWRLKLFRKIPIAIMKIKRYLKAF